MYVYVCQPNYDYTISVGPRSIAPGVVYESMTGREVQCSRKRVFGVVGLGILIRRSYKGRSWDPKEEEGSCQHYARAHAGCCPPMRSLLAGKAGRVCSALPASPALEGAGGQGHARRSRPPMRLSLDATLWTR